MSAPQTLATLGSPLQAFTTQRGGLAQLIKIALLARIAGAPYNSMTPNQLSAIGSPFAGTFNCSLADGIEIALLDAIGAGAGQRGTGGAAIFTGHYGGGPPNNDPNPVNGDIGTDLDAGNRQWNYINGWQ